MTPFGYGSLPRNDMGFNRICGGGFISCPGSNFSVIRTDNPDNLTINTEWPDGYYTNISLETQNLWASGLDTMDSKSLKGWWSIKHEVGLGFVITPFPLSLLVEPRGQKTFCLSFPKQVALTTI
jgi:hypothetical protein